MNRTRIAALTLGAWLTAVLSAQAVNPNEKSMVCPSAAPALVGDKGGRSDLCFWNLDDTKRVCFSTASSFTCNGTKATDGAPFKPGSGYCPTKSDAGNPATVNWYCRSQTSDSDIGFTEVFAGDNQ